MSESRVIVALDFPKADAALKLALTLNPALCKVKVGKELFVSAGPDIVEKLARLGFDVFLDLKFHDIPNTIASACRAAANLGAWMINVHVTGGRAMLDAARKAVPGPQPKLVAVTLLTSLTSDDLNDLGIAGGHDAVVLRWAKLAHECGLDGVVCSPLEAAMLKQSLGKVFLTVTPGIRLGESRDDQKRVSTPIQAIEYGADYIVIGRPVTEAKNPYEVLCDINQQIEVSLTK